MAQQYGEGVAEALAKKREGATLDALSSTNRLARYAPYLCAYTLFVFFGWCVLWTAIAQLPSAPLLSMSEEQAFRSFSFASSGAFATSFVFQLMQLHDSSVKGSVRSAPVYCTAVINLVSFCSHMSMALSYHPLLVSPVGRMHHMVRWGEWIAVAPVLLVMMQSLDLRSAADTKFMMMSAAIQLAGMLAGLGSVLAPSPQISALLLGMQYICGSQIFVVMHRSMGRYRQIQLFDAYSSKQNQSPLQMMISSRLQEIDSSTDLNDMTHMRLLKDTAVASDLNDGEDRDGSSDILGAVRGIGVVVAFKLSIYCCGTWTLFLAVSLFAHLGAISHFQEAVLLSLLDILDKCLYARVLCSGHGTAVSPEGLLTRMLVLEEQANASIRLFMRFIFHEVSGPLNSINYGLEFLKNEPLDENGRDTLRTVVQSAEEIQETLEMFRQQKSVTANLYAKLKPVNFKELVREVTKKHADGADKGDVSLLLALDQRIPETMLMNESGMRIAISSFIANGLALASQPGGSCTVIAELKSKVMQKDEVSVLFSVKDDGRCLSAAECDALFAPFSRLKAGNSKSGDRVSLSSAKQILEVHGAKVGFMSSEGKGSNFYFLIDLKIPSRIEEGTADFLSTEILNTDISSRFQQQPTAVRSLANTMRSSLALSKHENLPKDAAPVTATVKRMQLTSASTVPMTAPTLRIVQSPSSRSSGMSPTARAELPSELPIFEMINSRPQSVSPALEAKGVEEVPLLVEERNRDIEPAVDTEAAQTMEYEQFPAAESAVGGFQSPDGSLTALLVDDVRSNRRIYGRVLEMHGFLVTTADDGLQALDRIGEADPPYSIILIDHSMPNLEGVETVRRLRAQGYVGKIVGLSGTDDNSPEFVEAGVDAVLNKPLESVHLQEVLVQLNLPFKLLEF